jgi:hypothetical protein
LTTESAPNNPPAGGEPSDVKTLPLGDRAAVLRVLDAAANRAREGLRTVEDYVRFVLDDRHLTGQCKQLRHDLTAAVEQICRVRETHQASRVRETHQAQPTEIGRAHV